MQACWITYPQKSKAPEIYLFRKEFTAQRGAKLTAKISADTRYKLYINGRLTVFGPCKGTDKTTYFEQADLSEYLVEGRNIIEAKVLYLDNIYCEPPIIPLLFSVSRKGMGAAFVFDGILTEDGQDKPLVTDTDWQTAVCDNVSLTTGLNECSYAALCEHVTGGEPEFVPAVIFENIAERNISYLGKIPLRERIIPLMRVDGKKLLLEDKTIPPHTKTYIDLDNGVMTTAFVTAVFTGGVGSRVKITYAESYEFYEDGKYVKKVRDDKSGTVRGFGDIIDICGDTVFEPFWYKPFRIVRLEIETADEPLTISEFSHRETCYPLEYDTYFTCSDEEYNRMWEISARTLKLCMQETFDDCPYYEQAQYEMDSRIQMLCSFSLSNDYRLAKKALTDFSDSATPDGFLMSRYPSEMKQIIPGFSLHFVMMLAEYLDYSGDVEFAKAKMSITDGILSCFDRYINENGIIGKTGYWTYVDWVDGWEFGMPDSEQPLAVYNFMYAAALGAAAGIAVKIGRKGLAEEYKQRRERLISAAREQFFDEERGIFADVPTKNLFSEHAQIWAILADAVDLDEARTIMDRASSFADVKKCSFSMRFFTLRVMEKVGKYEQSDRLYDAWRTAMNLHCSTWPERSYGNPRSDCHAWSAVMLYEFPRVILGVRITDEPDLIEIKPYTKLLDWAEGKASTPRGDVFVRWEKKSAGLKLTVKAPDGVRLKITANGKTELCGREFDNIIGGN